MRLWLIAGAVCLACPIPGLSSDVTAEDPVELPPVVVPLPDEDPVEATRRDPTGAVTVIEVQARSSEAKDTAELIASAPGVHLQQSGGVGQKSTLILRGASPSGVVVLLDGIPLHGAGGIADLSLLPTAILDRLEVLRGGAGATFGSGGLGGAVNAITRRIPAGARVFGDLRYGSFDTALATLGAAGPLFGGDALLLLHGTRSDGDYPFQFDAQPANPDNALEDRTRVNNAAALGGGMVKLARRFGDWNAQLLADGLAYQRGLAGTSRNPTFDAGESGTRLATAVRAAGPVGDGTLSARGFWRTEGSRFHGGLYPSPFAQRFSAGGFAADGAWPLGRSQLLSVAANAHLEGVRTPERDPARLTGSVVASDELLLFDGVLTVVPALRVESVAAVRTPDGVAGTAFWMASPKLGLTWLLPAGLELRANAGQSARVPSMLELYVAQGTLLPNPLLRPERAVHGDLGLAWQGTTSRVSATAYYAFYDDLIAYEYYPPFLARPRNIDRADVGGVELELATDLPATLRVESAYTLTLSRNLRDDARFLGKPLPGRPLHHGTVRVAGGPEWLRARFEADYRSAQSLNRTGTLQLPARWLLNAGLSTRLLRHPELGAAVEVRNLLDVHAEDFDGYPLPPRSIHFTLSAAIEPRSNPVSREHER